MTFTTACSPLHDILWTDSSSARATSSGPSPQPAVDAVQVRIEIEHLRHVGVADVAVGDQSDAQVRRRLSLGDEAGEAPDLLLGAFDQSGHRTGRIEGEY